MKSNRKNNKPKRNDQFARTFDQNVVDLPNVRRKRKEVNLIPRNTKQEEYIDKLNHYGNDIVFAIGPAGTGKTMLAVQKAIKELQLGSIDRIIISRPAVEADEKLGFLPGDINEKMDPWVRPIMDVFHEYYTKPETEKMLSEGTIEIAPCAFLRGRTFKSAIVIIDEAQNLTINQMKMVLTRIGDDSRMFITGDTKQTDLRMKNGLTDMLEKLSAQKVPGLDLVVFTKDHVERAPIVTEILKLYGEDE